MATSKRDWIGAKQRKSLATQLTSKLDLQLSSVRDRLKNYESLDHREKVALQKQVESLELLYRDMEVERAWVGAYDKQMDFADAFHGRVGRERERDSGKIFVLIGGNRSGKTYAASRLCFAEHLMYHAKPRSVYWCVAPTYEKSIERQQKDLWDSLPREMFGPEQWDERNGFNANRPVIVLEPGKGGRRITIKFMSEEQWRRNPRVFESVPIDGAWVDESISEEAYDTLYMRTIDKAAFVLFSCIPDNEWMYDRFENAPPNSGIVYQKVTMLDNPHLPEEEIRKMEQQPDEVKNMRLYGNFQFQGSVVYKEFIKKYAPEGHLCKPFNIPKDWPHYMAMDWGNTHPSVILLSAVAPNGTLYVFDEFYRQYPHVELLAETAQDMMRGRNMAMPPMLDHMAFKADQGDGSSIAIKLARAGLETIPSPRSNEWSKAAQVSEIKRRLMDRGPRGPMLQVFDTCEWTCWEFRRWKFKKGSRNQMLETDRFEKIHDDCMDCLRYIGTMQPQWDVPKVTAFDTEG